ncbi:ATP-binding protein [Paenibacillus sp. RC84]|uniref:sensor histidine kinase n=1 Tax=Paenibacillus sp. RC84 TaxID=3156252 RepID=UPI00351870DD
MFTKPQTQPQTMPMLRFWTWRYALILFITLLIVSLIAGVWITSNANRQSYEVLQARAEQLADSYARVMTLYQLSSPAQTQGSIRTEVRANPAVKVSPSTTSVNVISPIEVARPLGDEMMQIVNRQGNLDTYSSSGAQYDNAERPGGYAAVLKGQTDRESFSLNDRTWLRVGVPLMDRGSVIGALYLSTPTPDNAEQTRQTYVIAVLITLGLALGGWTAIYLLLRKLTRPLRQLANAALQVADGHYAPVLPVAPMKERELMQLFTSFNEMTSRLRQLEQMRTDLLAGVSHELRTPLTSIRGMVQAVHGKVVTGGEANEFLEISLEETKRMQKMIDDMLEFSSLEAGAVHSERTTVDLSRLVTHLTQQLSSLPVCANVRVETVLPAQTIRLLADQGQLKQMLMNLIMNSTAAGSTSITVHAYPLGSMIHVDVKDNGSGIRESEVPHIFERYYRGDSRRKKKQGLGLGLPLSRLLAQANGGELALQETSPKGTVFKLTLPAV